MRHRVAATVLEPRVGVWARLSWLVLVGLLALPLACVNPFEPAEPEIGAGGITVPEDFSTPEDLLATIELAISAKANGTSAYLHAMAESTRVGDLAFRAYYDPEVKRNFETTGPAPEPWDLDYERAFPGNLASRRPQDSYTFQIIRDDSTFPLDDFPSNGSDTGLVHRRYLLRAKSPNSGDDTSGEIIAIGFADLSLRRDSNGRWAIFRWMDHVDPAVTANPAAFEQRCWSYRRLQSLSRPR
jgi:hypothetical protein